MDIRRCSNTLQSLQVLAELFVYLVDVLIRCEIYTNPGEFASNDSWILDFEKAIYK